MAPGGGIYPLTVSFEPASIPVQSLVSGGIKIQGSAVASRLAIRRMLNFVVLHHIRPITITFPLNQAGLEKAFQTLEEGKMRYRGVLVADKHFQPNR
jgi:D-arabinose 1-dehydrogenase-like Zn-dependent alcohol dehydrogenase